VGRGLSQPGTRYHEGQEVCEWHSLTGLNAPPSKAFPAR
jgi:hypothetical protein